MVVTLRWSEFDGGFRIEVGPTNRSPNVSAGGAVWRVRRRLLFSPNSRCVEVVQT